MNKAIALNRLSKATMLHYDGITSHNFPGALEDAVSAGCSTADIAETINSALERMTTR